MPRQFYTDDERTMIFVSTIESRRSGLSWVEAHSISQKAGFKGGVVALQIFIKNQRKKNKEHAREVDKRVQASMNPVNQIEEAVERIVKERVRVALTNAIEVLKNSFQ